jgi:hypothetical protein
MPFRSAGTGGSGAEEAAARQATIARASGSRPCGLPFFALFACGVRAARGAQF